MASRAHRHPRATILVAVVGALVMLQLLVVALTLGGARDHDLTVRRVESARALYAAEGVMNMALREVCLSMDEDGDGVVGGIASGTPGSPMGIGGSADGSVVVGTEGGGTVCVARGHSGESVHLVRCELD